jgi:FdhD protein
MENNFITNMQVKKISTDHILDVEDQLVVEEPLEIQIEYGPAEKRMHKSISVTMRTPGNDMELAVGFLFTEGIIKSNREILCIEQEESDINRITVALQPAIKVNLKNTERNFYTTSSCGVCGKASIDAIKTVSIYKNETDAILLKAELFYGIHETLRNRQAIFDSTGGLHASALFDLAGNFLMLREDVGRHNALDKLIGASLLNEQLPLHNNILLLSGRASFELIQKASMAGIKVICAVGAPSSLAVELAKECGITLIGFLREERFNIYSGKERIRL